VPTENARVLWVDAAKGLAIALVVLAHVLGGVLARGWLDKSGPFEQVYRYIYLFHMPLFFMVSGFFFVEAARRSPIGALVSRTGATAWPYLLWDFIIRTAALPFLVPFMGSPPASIGLLDRLWPALTGELSWFLWTLYVMQVALIPLARIPTNILLIASIAACVGLAGVNVGPARTVVDHCPFLLFGAVMYPYLACPDPAGRHIRLGLCLGGFILLAGALALDWTSIKVIWLLCGLIGSLAAILLVQMLPAAHPVLARFGVASLAIYVLHPYFQGASRYVVSLAVGNSPFWQLLVPTSIALVASLIVYQLALQYRMGWLFRLRLSTKWSMPH
jgi:fucose 4-O-acetylase-like acetyltransferase